MMQEIYQRGPIACSIGATPELHNYTGGIFEDKTHMNSTNHAVSVVGWGIENDVKYWLVRNSWGSSWGENGFFRIVKGTNNILIESHCSFAVPEDTWTQRLTHNTTLEEKSDPLNQN